jgi:phosphomevalonate kinase
VIVAEAPGKLVALGEYAVLDGAPALVLALDRYAAVTLGDSPDGFCHLETRAPEPARRVFSPGESSGAGLLDLVTQRVEPPPLAWRATVDSRAFFAGDAKLGLGSSAAVLCAFAGAFAGFAQSRGRPLPGLDLATLIGMHRAFQGGRGSGLDVAASLHGGAITFRLDPAGVPQVGSVRLPNSVGFAGIFAGRSASTPEFVAHYRAWRRDRPEQAAAMHRRLVQLAEDGCAAARGDDADAFVASLGEYGRALQSLGEAIGAEIVTAEHREIGQHARKHGVAYKVSGAGGGDLGLACAVDSGALAAFVQSVTNRGFRVIRVSLAGHGLKVEQRAGETQP